MLPSLRDCNKIYLQLVSLVSILGTCDKAAQEMIKLSERKCFEELMTLSSV